jgi:hypothetical protein
MTEGRRFPAPWTVEEYRGISYIVRDANNFAVAYVYFASESGHTRYLMTKDGSYCARIREIWTHRCLSKAGSQPWSLSSARWASAQY